MERSLPPEVDLTVDDFQALKEVHDQNMNIMQEQEDKINLQEQALIERDDIIERLQKSLNKQKGKDKDKEESEGSEEEKEVISPIRTNKKRQTQIEEGNQGSSSETSYLPIKLTKTQPQTANIYSKPSILFRRNPFTDNTYQFKSNPNNPFIHQTDFISEKPKRQNKEQMVTVGDKYIKVQVINSESKYDEVPKLKSLQDYSWYNRILNYINTRRREDHWDEGDLKRAVRKGLRKQQTMIDGGNYPNANAYLFDVADGLGLITSLLDNDILSNMKQKTNESIQDYNIRFLNEYYGSPINSELACKYYLDSINKELSKQVRLNNQNTKPEIGLFTRSAIKTANILGMNKKENNEKKDKKKKKQKKESSSEEDSSSEEEVNVINLICYRCGGRGHFKKDCPTPIDDNYKRTNENMNRTNQNNYYKDNYSGRGYGRGYGERGGYNGRGNYSGRSDYRGRGDFRGRGRGYYGNQNGGGNYNRENEANKSNEAGRENAVNRGNTLQEGSSSST